MAYPMMVSEQSFQDPASYRSYVEGEGLKRAAYLASMDQFYAQLEEATRQFDATLSYKEDVLASEERMFGESLAESTRQFDEEMAYNKWLAEEKLTLAKSAQESESWYREQQVRLARDELDLREDLAETRTGIGESYYSSMNPFQERELADLSYQVSKSALQSALDTTEKRKSGAVTLSPGSTPAYQPSSGYEFPYSSPDISTQFWDPDAWA